MKPRNPDSGERNEKGQQNNTINRSLNDELLRILAN